MAPYTRHGGRHDLHDLMRISLWKVVVSHRYQGPPNEVFTSLANHGEGRSS